VQRTPFLIILQSEIDTANPCFIHLDTLVDIKDEVVLNTACSFALNLGIRELKIQCLTSIEYQEWMAALDLAFQMVHSAQITKPRRKSVNSEVSLSNAIPLAPSLRRSQTTTKTLDVSNPSLPPALPQKDLQRLD
jgi:hypothetical protein